MNDTQLMFLFFLDFLPQAQAHVPLKISLQPPFGAWFTSCETLIYAIRAVWSCLAALAVMTDPIKIEIDSVIYHL